MRRREGQRRARLGTFFFCSYSSFYLPERLDTPLFFFLGPFFSPLDLPLFCCFFVCINKCSPFMFLSSRLLLSCPLFVVLFVSVYLTRWLFPSSSDGLHHPRAALVWDRSSPRLFPSLAIALFLGTNLSCHAQGVYESRGESVREAKGRREKEEDPLHHSDLVVCFLSIALHPLPLSMLFVFWFRLLVCFVDPSSAQFHPFTGFFMICVLFASFFLFCFFPSLSFFCYLTELKYIQWIRTTHSW